ncbi:hypothetical protein QTI66_35595 [Variovorax sp. J22R133]|nr:hypothetical protein [Variovorax sp. J22R133]MDM0117443.1 hypothetical protein [Variovorax sp. J22R133]
MNAASVPNGIVGRQGRVQNKDNVAWMQKNSEAEALSDSIFPFMFY